MTFKANIPTDPRVIYTLKGGDDSEDGLSLETAKVSIQGAVDAANALSPTALDRVSIIVDGAGVFAENITFPDFTSVDAQRTTNAVSSGTNYTLGSFSGYSFGLTANSGTSETVFAAANETSISLDCSEINITGDGTTALAVSGTTDDSFFNISQLRLQGDGAIGVNYTASNGEPEVFIFASITLEDDNTIAYIHDPSISTARAIFDVAGISEIGAPLTTTGIQVLDGHLSAFVNEIIAGDAIDLQGGELAIISNCITGDITVAVGATLICEITEFTGVLTNNGTIQGRIGTQQFGSGFVTGPGPTVVDSSIPAWSGTGGETLTNFDNFTLADNGTTATLAINSPIASTGTSRILVNNSLGTLKGELEYIEATDTVELLTTTAQLTFGQGPSAGTVEILGNDTQFLYLTGGTGNAFTIDMGSSPDTNPPFIIDNGGTNGALTEFYVGDRSPAGNVSAAPGAVYYRVDGFSSGIFVHADTTTSTDIWVQLGNTFGADSSTDNALTSWDGTSGKVIQDNPNTQLVDDNTDITLSLQNPLITGSTFFTMLDSTSAEAFRIEHDEGSSLDILSSVGQFNIGHPSGFGASGLTFVGDDILFELTESFSSVTFSASHTDTAPIFVLDTGGATGELVEFFVGDRSPEGIVSSQPGDIYYRNSGVTSTMYIHRAAGSGNTGWEPTVTSVESSSTINAIPSFNGTDGYTIEQTGNLSVTASATSTLLHIGAITAAGSANILFEDDTATFQAAFGFSNSLNLLSMSNSVGDIDFVSSTGDFKFQGTGTSNTLIELENSDVSAIAGIIIENAAGGNIIEFTYNEPLDISTLRDTSGAGLDINSEELIQLRGVGLADTDRLLSLVTTSTNGATVDFFVGTRNPETNIVADPGAFYFRRSGVNSDLFIHRSASTNATGWVDVLETGIKATGTITINTPAVWADSVGDELKSLDNMLFGQTASITEILLSSGSVTGFSVFAVRNSASNARGFFQYDEANDLTTFGTVTNNLDITVDGNDLTIETTTSGTLALEGVAALNISSGTSDSVLINSLFEFLPTAANSVLEITSPTATGDAATIYRNSSSLRRFRMRYDENTDVSSIETFNDTTELLITSEEQPVNIDIQITDANPILRLTNTENGFDIYSRSVNPAGSVSGTHGDIVVAGNGINNTAIYLQRESTSSTSWGQVELLQKQFDFVNSTSTLSLNHNRIILDNTSDITLSLPTNASNSRSEGFEQTITKNISNDDVITIDTPGFYGHTGNFVMSQRGDTVSYLQTSSANVILYTTRSVIAAMTRPLSAGETTINGFTGADIDLTIFTLNVESYEGLAEADQANDLIVFPDVENLSAGDQYLATLTVVVRWSNNEEITFSLFVDDAGIETEYPLLMQAQSTAIADEVTMHGRVLIRTGTNDTISLDTNVRGSFTLATGASAIFGAAIFTVEKIEGK